VAIAYLLFLFLNLLNILFNSYSMLLFTYIQIIIIIRDYFIAIMFTLFNWSY